MIIVSVDAIPVSLPFAHAVSLSTGTRSSSEHVLVVVETDGGIRGYAECTPRPTLYGETVSGAVAMVRETLAPMLVGVAVTATDEIVGRLGRIAGNPSARSAVEMAAFDAAGKVWGVSCLDLLGGFTTSVPLAALLGYGAPRQVANEAVGLGDQAGIEAFKFKIGPDVETDIQVARLLRAELGAAAVLYADANQRYEPWEAVRFAKATAECDLRFIEEPTAAIHHLRVTRQTSICIVADESACDLEHADQVLQTGGYLGVSIKPARTGLRESARIRDLAVLRGATPILGSQGDGAVGAIIAATFAAATRLTATNPAELHFFTGMAEHLVTTPPRIHQGRLHLNSGPGFGFEIDMDKLRAFRLQSQP